MNKYDEAIEIIERMMFAFATTKVDGIHIYPTLKLAIEALQQAKECENPQPLTIEQLKKRVGKPVWVKVDNCSWIPNGGYWCLTLENGILAPSCNYRLFESCINDGFYDHELKGEK